MLGVIQDVLSWFLACFLISYKNKMYLLDEVHCIYFYLDLLLHCNKSINSHFIICVFFPAALFSKCFYFLLRFFLCDFFWCACFRCAFFLEPLLVRLQYISWYSMPSIYLLVQYVFNISWYSVNISLDTVRIQYISWYAFNITLGTVRLQYIFWYSMSSISFGSPSIYLLIRLQYISWYCTPSKLLGTHYIYLLVGLQYLLLSSI